MHAVRTASNGAKSHLARLGKEILQVGPPAAASLAGRAPSAGTGAMLTQWQ